MPDLMPPDGGIFCIPHFAEDERAETYPCSQASGNKLLSRIILLLSRLAKFASSCQ